ncbi:MAG: metal ABC transporter substrate-binding protein [Gemmatimonadetes bacterium]|nr:metal ABC transporter substrate-binding protein [Gemmatimonadota bacterium]
MTMTNSLALIALFGGTALSAQAPQVTPVRVVTTLPVYGSITSAIGGNQVEVVSIADPHEDSHFVRPKPSHALELRRADLFVTTGLDLELWVPALLDKGGNARVLEGQPGYVTAYTGITLLDIPAVADRSQGDVHIFGNPHVHTDPLRALQVARNITTGLKRVAPDRAAHFDAGLNRYQEETWNRLFGARLVELLGGATLEQLALNGTLFPFLESNDFEGTPLVTQLGGWLQRGASLRGRDILCYHVNWSYFEDRFGVNCLEYVETKPGIPPTPRHVARLISLMRERGLSVVIAADYFGEARVRSVADRGGAVALILPMQTHARPGIDTYFDLVDAWVDGLAGALR